MPNIRTVSFTATAQRCFVAQKGRQVLLEIGTSRVTQDQGDPRVIT